MAVTIEKTEVTNYNVDVTLSNGVVISLSVTNPEYVYLTLSGIKGGITASCFPHDDSLPRWGMSNFVCLLYQSRKDE